MTTLVTAANLADLRRMVAEPTTATYSDALLTLTIEKYPLLDEQGEEPFTLSSATPPVHVVNTDWMPTYDLNAAAADVWQEKAATWVTLYDFSADGGNYSRMQTYNAMQTQARFYRSRRAMGTTRLHQWPEEPAADVYTWVANINDPKE